MRFGVADKFHVIKHALDSLQELRIRYRREELTKRRIEYEKHKKLERIRSQECKQQNIIYKKKKYEYKEPLLNNGETILQLLAKSRYLLYKFPEKWDDYQQERAKILFKEYPKLKKAYELTCEFRNWMKKKYW